MQMRCGVCAGSSTMGADDCEQCGGNGVIDVPECEHPTLRRDAAGFYFCTECKAHAEVTVKGTHLAGVWMPQGCEPMWAQPDPTD